MKRLLICLLLVSVVGCEQPAPAPIAPNKAISESNKAEAEFNKGIDFADREDWTTAIACFDKAIQLAPYYANAYYHRGRAYIHLESTTRRLRIAPLRFE
jgi:tetratricopeptide (TPR) repeat protein